jgi:replicative DNA helicase
MSKLRFVPAADVFDSWRDDVLTGKPPTFFRVADAGPMAGIEIGPKLITLIGGAPGSGKTAFIMQCVFDALRLSPTLRAVVCNIEMPPEVLLDRQLSRLSGVPLKAIRYRQLSAIHADRIDAGMNAIETIADRFCFVRSPFTLENVAATADRFAPLGDGSSLLLVLDYIQRIAPPGSQGDKRGSVDATMNFLRQFADAGAAVLVVSSVGRQKDAKGRTSYGGDALNLASFKESGELEFGADDAFILAPSEKLAGVRELRHLKARNGECRDISLEFDGSIQRFTAIEDSNEGSTGAWSSALSELWGRTEPKGATTWKP